MNAMKALILSGGMSRRMGSDKGLITDGGITRIEKIYHILTEHFSEVFLSIRKDQKSSYLNYFAPDIFIYDSCLYGSLRGPLLGMASFCEKFNDEYFFVTACDMPDIHGNLIDKLLTCVHSENGFQAYLFTHGENQEPLFGVYRTADVMNYVKIFRNSEEKDPADPDYSLISMLQKMHVHQTDLPDADHKFLKNYNYPE